LEVIKGFRTFEEALGGGVNISSDVFLTKPVPKFCPAHSLTQLFSMSLRPSVYDDNFEDTGFAGPSLIGAVAITCAASLFTNLPLDIGISTT
jgi:hypothetical protein